MSLYRINPDLQSFIGINTKLIQTVAHTLNVPMDIISLKPVDVLTSPQNSPSWGSWTTDGMCSSAKTACTTMKDRLQQVRSLKLRR